MAEDGGVLTVVINMTDKPVSAAGAKKCVRAGAKHLIGNYKGSMADVLQPTSARLVHRSDREIRNQRTASQGAVLQKRGFIMLKRNKMCPICYFRRALIGAPSVDRPSAAPYENGSGDTPLMGWSSWNTSATTLTRNS